MQGLFHDHLESLLAEEEASRTHRDRPSLLSTAPPTPQSTATARQGRAKLDLQVHDAARLASAETGSGRKCLQLMVVIIAISAIDTDDASIR